MAGLTVVTPPAAEPLALSDVKAYLRVSGSAEDTLISTFIETARVFCENFIGRALITQTLKLSLDSADHGGDPLWEGTRIGPDLNFYKSFISLPNSPVQSVTSVKTFADDDTETTLSTSKYYSDLTREPARIVLRTGETWPTALRVANAIEIVYVAGYGDSASDVPSPLRIGMMQHIAYLYDQRGDMKDYQQAQTMPPAVPNMYQSYKSLSGLGGSNLMAIG